MPFNYNIDDEKSLISARSHCLCGVCVFSPCLGGSLQIPQFPEMYTWGELACPHCPSVCEWVWVCMTVPVTEGCPVCGGLYLVPWAAETGLHYLRFWTEISGLEKTDLVCINLFEGTHTSSGSFIVLRFTFCSPHLVNFCERHKLCVESHVDIPLFLASFFEKTVFWSIALPFLICQRLVEYIYVVYSWILFCSIDLIVCSSPIYHIVSVLAL